MKIEDYLHEVLLVSYFSARNEPSKVINRETSERAEKRKKKKSYYAKLKREEDDKMAELAAKYRDR
jgi:IK cytokine